MSSIDFTNQGGLPDWLRYTGLPLDSGDKPVRDQEEKSGDGIYTVTGSGVEPVVALYQGAVIIAHQYCTLIGCVACGKLRGCFVIEDGELTAAQYHRLMASVSHQPHCTCHAAKEEVSA